MSHPCNLLRRSAGDAGNAVVEFILIPLLLLPLLLGFTHLFVHMKLDSALDDAVRSAARAYAVTGSDPDAAEIAARLALSDRGVTGRANFRSGEPATLTVVGWVRSSFSGHRVEVRRKAELP